MKKYRIGFITILLIAAGVIAFQPSESLSQVIAITGKDIYRLNCAGCHSTDRSGYSDIYPSLINIQDRLSKEEVLNQINNGKGLMPPFSHLTTEERDALWSFIKSLEGKGEPDRPNMGEMCPMMMKMRKR
jgi:mono/diheme cytochrome c family protein